MAIEPRVWAEGRTLRFEWINDTDEPIEFCTVGAVMSDAQGNIMDVIRTTRSRTRAIAPGETLAFEKELAPYITQDMLDGATFAPYAYRFPASGGDDLVIQQ